MYSVWEWLSHVFLFFVCSTFQHFHFRQTEEQRKTGREKWGCTNKHIMIDWVRTGCLPSNIAQSSPCSLLPPCGHHGNISATGTTGINVSFPCAYVLQKIKQAYFLAASTLSLTGLSTVVREKWVIIYGYLLFTACLPPWPYHNPHKYPWVTVPEIPPNLW